MSTIKKEIKKLETLLEELAECKFECEAGPLELCTTWKTIVGYAQKGFATRKQELTGHTGQTDEMEQLDCRSDYYELELIQLQLKLKLAEQVYALMKVNGVSPEELASRTGATVEWVEAVLEARVDMLLADVAEVHLAFNCGCGVNTEDTAYAKVWKQFNSRKKVVTK